MQGENLSFDESCSALHSSQRAVWAPFLGPVMRCKRVVVVVVVVPDLAGHDEKQGKRASM